VSNRLITLLLMALLVVVQAQLWFGEGGLPRVMDLQNKLQIQQTANATARQRNDQLLAEVRDLKEGLEMVEEKARYELGMVKPDELLVQIASPKR
jgi:cell division protein FtsB